MTHAPWLGSCVFDGARAFEGVAPDLDLHCQRIVRSAESFGLKILKNAGEIEEIIREGIAKFPKDRRTLSAPHVLGRRWLRRCRSRDRPNSPSRSMIRRCRSPRASRSRCRPSAGRPIEFAPTDAKAACHYPNSARAMREAKARGFDNAVMLDPLGNVAELATANIWLAKDGEAHTPVPNGTFLNGITRQRVIKLLRDAGVTVHERSHPLAGIPRGR